VEGSSLEGWTGGGKCQEKSTAYTTTVRGRKRKGIGGTAMSPVNLSGKPGQKGGIEKGGCGPPFSSSPKKKGTRIVNDKEPLKE